MVYDSPTSTAYQSVGGVRYDVSDSLDTAWRCGGGDTGRVPVPCQIGGRYRHQDRAGAVFRRRGAPCDGDVAAGTGDGHQRGYRSRPARSGRRRRLRQQSLQPPHNRPDGHLLVAAVPPEPRRHVVGRDRDAGHHRHLARWDRRAHARYDDNVRRVAHQPAFDRARRRVRHRYVLHLPVRAERGGQRPRRPRRTNPSNTGRSSFLDTS